MLLLDERKVYGDILPNEIYPEDYRKESFCEVFDDEKICMLPERGATELGLGGESPKLSLAEDCSSDLKWNEWIERDIIDDMAGEHLPPELVSKAKVEELMEIYRRGVWKEVSVQE